MDPERVHRVLQGRRYFDSSISPSTPKIQWLPETLRIQGPRSPYFVSREWGYNWVPTPRCEAEGRSPRSPCDNTNILPSSILLQIRYPWRQGRQPDSPTA